MNKKIIDDIIEVCNKHKIQSRFEIEPNHNSEILTYLNFMGAIGGVYIRTCNAAKNRKIILECLMDTDENNFIKTIKYPKLIIDKMDNKYNQTGFIPKLDSVAILPGSNIMDITIDYKKLGEAVSKGAYIKPHPYTEEKDIVELKNIYGDSKILNISFGGCDVIKNSDTVYATGASELSLYSIILGKVVINIGNKNASTRGGYCAIFDVLQDVPHYLRPAALSKILSHKKSGIFFPFDISEKNLEDFILEHF